MARDPWKTGVGVRGRGKRGGRGAARGRRRRRVDARSGLFAGTASPPAPGARAALLPTRFAAHRVGRGSEKGGGLSSPWGPRPPAGCPRSSRRAGVAAAPEEQRLVPAGGDGASAVRGSGRARGASRGRRGLPASAPALPDPGARGARSPSAWTHPAAPPGCDKMDLTYRRALTVTRSLKAVLQQQTQI